MVTYARWHRRFKRISEAFAMFLPVTFALLMVFFASQVVSMYTHGRSRCTSSCTQSRILQNRLLLCTYRCWIGTSCWSFLSLLCKSLFVQTWVWRKKRWYEGILVPAAWESKLGGWAGAETEVKMLKASCLPSHRFFVLCMRSSCP